MINEPDPKMKLYDPNSLCPKCGGSNISATYIPKDEIPFNCDNGVTEYLRRGCIFCGYLWAEKPLNANW
jgi:hypothetical protein